MKKTELIILFYLLQDKVNVNKSIRQIADTTGASVGSVHSTLKILKDRGFLVETGTQRVLRKRNILIERWARGYAENLKSKLFVSRFTFLTPQVKDCWQKIVLPDTLAWGGEPATALLIDFIQPGRWDIYTKDKADALIATGRMIPDSQGEVFVYKKFWQSSTVPLLVVYADLLYTDDARCLEAAEKIKKLI